MNCRACDYPLWNLRSRTCPECGAGFRPSDFDFVRSAVRFMCPHCGQAYYGTGDRGHLVPARFDCVSCRAPIAMDDMVLLPTEGIAEARTKADRVPWMERTTRGFPRAWLGTISMAIFYPTRLIRATRDLGVASAWWFAIFTLFAVAIAGVLPAAVIVFFSPAAAMGMLLALAGALALGAAAASVFIALWGLLAHGVLALTGPTAGTIGQTYKAICLASAVNVVAAVPCIGVYIMILVVPLWWAIVVMLMLMECHRVAAWRALIAGLVAPALAYAGMIGLWVFWFSVALSSVSAARTTLSVAQPLIQTKSLVNAVVSERAADGSGPPHASALIGSIGPADMIVSEVTGTTKADVPVGPITLDRYFVSTPQERQNALQAASETLPAGVIAHRWGDFVFVYHGIDLRQPDPRLWLVVFSPDPGASQAVSPMSPLITAIPVGTADGTVNQIPLAQFAQRLAQQNEIRVELGLPPLPDPATITHQAPAVSESP